MKLVLCITLCCLATLCMAGAPKYKQVKDFNVQQAEFVIQATEGYYIWQNEEGVVFSVQNEEQVQISPTANCPTPAYFTYALQNNQYYCFVNGTEPNTIIVNEIDILTGDLIGQTNYSDVYFPPFNAEMNGNYYEFINSSLPLGNFEAKIFSLALNQFVCSPVINYPANLETLGSLPEVDYFIFIAGDPTTKIVTYFYFDCQTEEVTEINTNIEAEYITMQGFLNGDVGVAMIETIVQGEQAILLQTWEKSNIKNTYQLPSSVSRPGNKEYGVMQVIDSTSFFLSSGSGNMNLSVFDVSPDAKIHLSSSILLPANSVGFWPGFEANTFWTQAYATTIFFDYTTLQINSLINGQTPTLDFANGEVISITELGYFITYPTGNTKYFSLAYNAGYYYDHTGIIYLFNAECNNGTMTVFNASDSSISTVTYPQFACGLQTPIQLMDAQVLNNGEYAATVLSSFQYVNVMIGNTESYEVSGLESLGVSDIFADYNNLEINLLTTGSTFELVTVSLQSNQILSNHTISNIPFNGWSVVKLNSTLFVYGGNNLTGGMGNVFDVATMSIIQSTKLPFLNNNIGGSPFLPLGINLQGTPIVSGFVATHLVTSVSYPVVLANYKGDYVTLPNVEALDIFPAGYNRFYIDLGNMDFPSYLYEVDSFTVEEMVPKLRLRKHIDALLHGIIA